MTHSSRPQPPSSLLLRALFVGGLFLTVLGIGSQAAPPAGQGHGHGHGRTLMAEPTDRNGDSHHNGQYAMYLTVAQPGPDNGPNQIKVGENLNPIKSLRGRYDAWRQKQPASFR